MKVRILELSVFSYELVCLCLKLALPAQLNVFDFLFNRGEIRRLFHRGAALLIVSALFASCLKSRPLRDAPQAQRSFSL